MNVLICILRMDQDYRREVERSGTLGKVLNTAAGIAFLARYSPEAQLVYKVAAHVDGTFVLYYVNYLN